jgi:hypothetical protein
MLWLVFSVELHKLIITIETSFYFQERLEVNVDKQTLVGIHNFQHFGFVFKND